MPGACHSVSAGVVTWNRTWGGCVELARVLALAQGSKQATRDVQAQLWAMCRLGGCESSLKLAVPSCLLRPECLSACVPLCTLGQSLCTPAPHRAAGVPQDSSLYFHGGLGGYWGCRITPGLLSISPWGLSRCQGRGGTSMHRPGCLCWAGWL